MCRKESTCHIGVTVPRYFKMFSTESLNFFVVEVNSRTGCLIEKDHAVLDERKSC